MHRQTTGGLPVVGCRFPPEFPSHLVCCIVCHCYGSDLLSTGCDMNSIPPNFFFSQTRQIIWYCLLAGVRVMWVSRSELGDVRLRITYYPNAWVLMRNGEFQVMKASTNSQHVATTTIGTLRSGRGFWGNRGGAMYRMDLWLICRWGRSSLAPQAPR